ncbi:maleylpyruvate isomerase N-terminal domain-containing protein [Streptomyces sp. NPDC020965]|uniref:maleylpyruvate isomerase N-terminal domain-containing protein n=1 Tax=Streptomyces sp. NPDC020965 TaxID=3365105 RepID=UPI0037A30B52
MIPTDHAPHRAPGTGAPPWPELLTAATARCLGALAAGSAEDWSRPAGDVDWSCRRTLDHLALGLVGYAGLLVARPTDRYVSLFASLDEQAPVGVCLEGVGIAAALLTGTVRQTPAGVRAWHPWGHADAAGFAAMGVAELTLHTYDITRGLGLPWAPPAEFAAAVLDRLFPDAPHGHPPADTLLWCPGRGALPGLPRRAEWRWDGTVRPPAGPTG